MAIARVQFKNVYTPPTQALAFTSNVTAGNMIVVAIVSANSGSTGITVTDNRGSTYTQINSVTNSTLLTNTRLFYGFPTSSGACTVTVGGGTLQDVGFLIAEYSGILQPNIIVTSLTATGASASVSVTLAGKAGGMLFSVYGNENPAAVAPAGTGTTTPTLINGVLSHSDYEWEVLNLSATQNFAIGYTTSTTYTNQTFIGAAFGHFATTTKVHTTDSSIIAPHNLLLLGAGR